MTPEEAAKIVNQRRYTLNEAAEKLGISRSSVQRARNQGKLRYAQIGGKVVVTEEHLAEFLAEAERQKLPEQRCARRRPHSSRRSV